jgi:hypothetical protein
MLPVPPPSGLPLGCVVLEDFFSIFLLSFKEK